LALIGPSTAASSIESVGARHLAKFNPVVLRQIHDGGNIPTPVSADRTRWNGAGIEPVAT